MINLFEYQNKEELTSEFDGLEEFLDEIWRQREKTGFYFGNDNGEDDKEEAQRFLQILHKTDEIKSNKYVGVIHYEGQKINLLPKIFYEADREYGKKDINTVHKHILWWLSYCRKIRFPNYQTSLGSEKSDFFEVLIYLFAKYTKELLGHSIYQQYEEVRREVRFVRGRMDINRYMKENLSQGRWHKVNCIFDPFVFDNRFNQIIKYVATILQNVTTNDDSKKYLREILFTLDDVSDFKASPEECSSIQFNPAFAEFETVRDYCQLFLDHSISFDYKNDLKLFAFLLPMEYVFEDFIFGFIEKELNNVQAISQVSSVHLDEDKSFLLKPDLILETNGKKIIADAKYKIAYSNDQDPKGGISQSDLYQMLSYAVRFKIDEIALFYPDTIQTYQEDYKEFRIKDQFAEDVNVTIRAWQLPIINRELLKIPSVRNMSLDDAFEGARNDLRERLSSIIFSAF